MREGGEEGESIIEISFTILSRRETVNRIGDHIRGCFFNMYPRSLLNATSVFRPTQSSRKRRLQALFLLFDISVKFAQEFQWQKSSIFT